MLLFHANRYKTFACFKHLHFFKVIDSISTAHVQQRVEQYSSRVVTETNPTLTLYSGTGQAFGKRNPTTSFLTATILIYATGAGITAAAGTRLSLQLILVKMFKLYSFQLPDLKKPGIVISSHYLPVLRLGNLRACCLPWTW